MKPLRMFPHDGEQEKPETLRFNLHAGNALHLRDLFRECGKPLPPRAKKITPPIIELPVIKKEKIQEPHTYPPLPQYNPKSVDERIAEAQAFRGEVPDHIVKDIIEDIRESARDFGEYIASESRPDTENASLSFNHKITDIQNVVAHHFNISRSEILSIARLSRIARPRQIVMYLSRILTNCSYEDIGNRTGERDHTTVIYAVQKITRLIEKDKAFAEEIAALKEMLV